MRAHKVGMIRILAGYTAEEAVAAGIGFGEEGSFEAAPLGPPPRNLGCQHPPQSHHWSDVSILHSPSFFGYGESFEERNWPGVQWEDE